MKFSDLRFLDFFVFQKDKNFLFVKTGPTRAQAVVLHGEQGTLSLAENPLDISPNYEVIQVIL